MHSSVCLGALVVLGAAVCAAQPRGRILGGQEAKPHEWPYMASVQVNGTHVCGGTLLSQSWVLSAAHCLDGLVQNESLQVLLGAHSLSQPEPSKRLYDVLRAVPHPDSRPQGIEHDLLLLQPKDQDLAAGTLCDVTGWGVVSHAGRKPDRLQHLRLPIMDRDTCNQRSHHDGAITENMICAQSNRKDSCRGDSGGPLICGGMAEGVVAWGSRVCGNRRKPGVYTRLGPYIDWIRNVTA